MSDSVEYKEAEAFLAPFRNDIKTSWTNARDNFVKKWKEENKDWIDKLEEISTAGNEVSKRLYEIKKDEKYKSEYTVLYDKMCKLNDYGYDLNRTSHLVFFRETRKKMNKNALVAVEGEIKKLNDRFSVTKLREKFNQYTIDLRKAIKDGGDKMKMCGVSVQSEYRGMSITFSEYYIPNLRDHFWDFDAFMRNVVLEFTGIGLEGKKKLLSVKYKVIINNPSL